MKKTEYMAPAIETDEISVHLLNAASITEVGGDTDIEMASEDEDIPGTAQGRRKSIWEDEELEDAIY